MKCAKFRSIGRHSFETVWHRRDDDSDTGEHEGYIRLSEWVEVDFPPIADQVVIEQEIIQLNAKAAEIRATLGVQIAAIEARKAELLCITDQRETA